MTELLMIALFLLFWVAVIAFIVFLFSIHWSIGILAIFVLLTKIF